MSHLSPPTLTEAEQRSILAATAANVRDHLIYSLALGTGLRLAEIVGLDVGDAFFPDGRPRTRVRIRPEIAKGGRSGDVFLPDALMAKLPKFCVWKAHRIWLPRQARSSTGTIGSGALSIVTKSSEEFSPL